MLLRRVAGGWPSRGDIVGCVHINHSMYEPRILLPQEALERQSIVRRCVPSDLALEICPIRVPLTRVECGHSRKHW